MNEPIVVKVDHVSMKFNLSSEKFDSFKEYVIKSIKKQENPAISHLDYVTNLHGVACLCLK